VRPSCSTSKKEIAVRAAILGTGQQPDSYFPEKQPDRYEFARLCASVSVSSLLLLGFVLSSGTARPNTHVMGPEWINTFSRVSGLESPGHCIIKARGPNTVQSIQSSPTQPTNLHPPNLRLLAGGHKAILQSQQWQIVRPCTPTN